MANGGLDTEFKEELHEAEKVLMDDIEWNREAENPSRYTMDVSVRVKESGEIMTMHGAYYEKGHSLVLRYRNEVIRRFDFADHWDGMAGHKHRSMFASIGEDDPYPVDDISTSDVNQAVIDFLNEENIDRGEYTINEKPEISDYD